jgi:glutamyl-tRNA synthetase
LANEFQELGYLPEAVVNFLTNVGWHFGDEREVFDVEEAIERFEISQINPANSAYPIEKLDWLNGIYIREKLSSDQLAERLRPPLETAGFAVDGDLLRKVAPLVQTRIKTLNDVVDIAGFFFREQFIPPEPEILIQKKMDIDETIQILNKAQEALAELDDFTTESTHTKMLKVVEGLGLNNGQVFGTLRAAVTGQKVSTPTFETMEILGKNETLKRLSLAVDILRRASITT